MNSNSPFFSNARTLNTFSYQLAIILAIRTLNFTHRKRFHTQIYFSSMILLSPHSIIRDNSTTTPLSDFAVEHSDEYHLGAASTGLKYPLRSEVTGEN